MISQYFSIKGYWNVVIYYNVSSNSIYHVENILQSIGCKQHDIDEICGALLRIDCAVTYTKPYDRLSIICFSRNSSDEQLVNTIVHEAKHLQSHICDYYGVREDGEQAAYLIGYIVQKMYRVVEKLIIGHG